MSAANATSGPMPVYGADGANLATGAEGVASVTTQSGVGASGRHYIPFSCDGSPVASLQIIYDASLVASAISVESCNKPENLVNNYDETDEWTDEPAVSPSLPNASAGSQMIHVGNNGARRLRLVITVSTAGEIAGWAWGKD
jgi:hypothetical protein